MSDTKLKTNSFAVENSTDTAWISSVNISAGKNLQAGETAYAMGSSFNTTWVTPGQVALKDMYSNPALTFHADDGTLLASISASTEGLIISAIGDINFGDNVTVNFPGKTDFENITATNIFTRPGGSLVFPVIELPDTGTEILGSVIWDEDNSSFSGWDGTNWVRMGGVSILGGSGEPTGSARTSVGDVWPMVPEPMNSDIWFDTANMVVKVYQGVYSVDGNGGWATFGAVYQ